MSQEIFANWVVLLNVGCPTLSSVKRRITLGNTNRANPPEGVLPMAGNPAADRLGSAKPVVPAATLDRQDGLKVARPPQQVVTAAKTAAKPQPPQKTGSEYVNALPSFLQVAYNMPKPAAKPVAKPSATENHAKKFATNPTAVATIDLTRAELNDLRAGWRTNKPIW